MMWEYHLEVLDVDGAIQLARLGQDQWELVAVVDKGQLLAYFKRPAAPPKQAPLRPAAGRPVTAAKKRRR
jgi:hypothetical protein